LSRRRLAATRLPVPSFPEQRQIAEVLDTVDEAIRKTEAILAKLKQVKQGLLRDLLTRGIDEYGELRDPERHPEQFKDSPLGRIPKAWEVYSLGDVADVSSGTTPARGHAAFWSPGEVPWVKTGEVDFSTIYDTDEKVSRRALSNTSLRLYGPSTVLVAMYGQGKTRGRSAILGVAATTNQACAAIVGNERIDQGFLFHYLSAEYARLRSLGHGSHQTNLSGALLSAMDVVVPPLEEQRKVALRISTLDTRSDEEGLSLSKFRKLKKGLMNDLLTGRVRVTPLLD